MNKKKGFSRTPDRREYCEYWSLTVLNKVLSLFYCVKWPGGVDLHQLKMHTEVFTSNT